MITSISDLISLSERFSPTIESVITMCHVKKVVDRPFSAKYPIIYPLCTCYYLVINILESDKFMYVVIARNGIYILHSAAKTRISDCLRIFTAMKPITTIHPPP